MDPLSITASVIAVLGAVSATGKTVHKIKTLRKAPEELAALFSEVDALRSVLIIAQTGIRRIRDTRAFEEVREPLQQLLARAESSGIELHQLLEYQLKRSEERDRRGRLKVDRTEWLKSGAELERIKQRIRDSRENLQMALTSLSLSTGSSTRELVMQLHSLQQQSRHPMALNDVPAISVGKRGNDFDDDLCSARRSKDLVIQKPLRDYPDLELRRATAIDTDDNTEAAVASDSAQRYGTSSTSDSSTFLIDCPIRCKCQCHNRTRCQTPEWLKTTLGELMVSFTPVFFPQPCNTSECRRSLRRAYLRYTFPTWLAYRALVLKICSGTLSGLGAIWSLRIPMVVEHPAVWDAVSKGNLLYVQRCLENRSLDPCMIAPSGENLVQYALQENQIRLYLFLHQAGFDNLFDGIGSGSTGASSAIVRHSLYLSTTAETISDQLGFLDMHSILALPQKSKSTIKDIIHANTVELLLAWTANPNVSDYSGVTPLHLACQKGNPAIVKTLLKAGAKVDKADDNGNTPLFWTTNADMLGLLSYWGADLHHVNDRGQTILHIFTGRGVDMSACITALACHGADNDAPDRIGLTPFHYAILRDVPSALRALRTAWRPKKRLSEVSRPPFARNFLHLAALFAGTEVMRELMLCDLTLQDPDAKDVSGCSPSDYFYQIRDKTYTTIRSPAEEEETVWLERLAMARRQSSGTNDSAAAPLLQQDTGLLADNSTGETDDEDEVFLDALEVLPS